MKSFFSAFILLPSAFILSSRAPFQRLFGTLRHFISPAAPFFQRGIPTALRQRPSTRSFNFNDFVSLFVDAKLQASATITVIAGVRYDPLAPFEFWPWPVTGDLITALHADGSFGLAIVEPDVCRRGISEPTTTRFEIR